MTVVEDSRVCRYDAKVDHRAKDMTVVEEG